MLYDVRCSTYDISLAIAGSTLRITSSVTMSGAGAGVMSPPVVSGFSRTKVNDELACLRDAKPVSREQQRGAGVFLNDRRTGEFGAGIELLALIHRTLDRRISLEPDGT